MIKINLLKQSAQATKSYNAQGFLSGLSSDADLGGDVTASNRGAVEILVKMVLFLLPTLLLYGYEQYNLGIKEEAVASAQARLTSIQNQITALKPEVEAVESFQQEKKKLDERLNTIKNLSKARLTAVRSLDALQDIIPKKTWLTELNLKPNKLELTGGAVDDEQIGLFMESLKKSIFFSQPSLLSSKLKQTPEGSIKEFKVEVQLGGFSGS